MISLPIAQQNLSEDDGIVVGLVMCRVDERDCAFPHQAAQSVKFIAVLTDFRCVSPAKFLPASRIVSEPFPKFGAWREFLHPTVDRCVGLLDPARPKPV